ncbi:MAG: 50S ribosomal protein L11 methyltransferase [Polyangiaceae bacterium]
MSEPVFPFVLIDVTRPQVEDFSMQLFDLGALGVEERDATTLVKSRKHDRITLVASFASREEAEAAVAELDPNLSPAIEEIIGDAWRDSWKEHFRPFEFCPGIVVRPPWEPYEKKGGEYVLELEPGRAFGTGLHETTSLVALVLAEHKETLRDASVLDLGCGSGILGLVGLVYGAKDVLFADIDPDAVEVSRENAERNGMLERGEYRASGIEGIQGTFPVVVANIEARVLIPMADALIDKVAPGGLLVLSGILVPQAEAVTQAYARPHLTPLEQKVRGEWVSLAFERS